MAENLVGFSVDGGKWHARHRGPNRASALGDVAAGAGNGSYSNNFVSTGKTNILSGGTGVGIVTNMVDTGGATASPSRYYRVRVLAP